MSVLVCTGRHAGPWNINLHPLWLCKGRSIAMRTPDYPDFTAIGGGRGGNLLRPLSQQWPIRTNQLSRSCLGLCSNGQQQCTNRLLVFALYKRSHCTTGLLKETRMLQPKISKMSSVKDAMPLITNCMDCAKDAPPQMPRHMGPTKPVQSA